MTRMKVKPTMKTAGPAVVHRAVVVVVAVEAAEAAEAAAVVAAVVAEEEGEEATRMMMNWAWSYSLRFLPVGWNDNLKTGLAGMKCTSDHSFEAVVQWPKCVRSNAVCPQGGSWPETTSAQSTS